MATDIQVTFDCADPATLSRFWAETLHYKLQDPPAGYASWPDFLREIGVPEEEWNSKSAVVDPDRRGPRLFFQRVPEPKTAKNRVHLDLNAGGGAETPLDERKVRVDEEVARLVGLGATKIGEATELGEYWVVMQDPEHNEFCVQ